MNSTAKGAIRTLLADDHQIVREGVRALLEGSMVSGERTITVVGDASDGPSAVALCKSLKPEVLVLDLTLPVLPGLEVANQVKALVQPPAIVVLSMHVSIEHLSRARREGVSAYVVKGSGVTELAGAIRRAAAGGQGPFPLLTQSEMPLTERERQVLAEIVTGASNKEVATRLGISVHTVNTHRVHLMEKLDAHDVATLTRLAVSLGLVS